HPQRVADAKTAVSTASLRIESGVDPLIGHQPPRHYSPEARLENHTQERPDRSADFSKEREWVRPRPQGFFDERRKVCRSLQQFSQDRGPLAQSANRAEHDALHAIQIARAPAPAHAHRIPGGHAGLLAMEELPIVERK